MQKSGAAIQSEKKKQQHALTVAEQIENLKQIGLIVEDESIAADFLSNVSYYRLIKAYSLKLKPKNGNYYNGTTFNQITELYLFNTDLRRLLFPQIERIEINLRCKLSNYFCLKYGIGGYLNKQNFDNYSLEFEQDLQREIRINYRSPIVRNFKNNYEDEIIPFYAFVELMSFGTLSKFFKNMKSSDKKYISGFYGVPYTYFESWIENIAYVRNICAHYGRIYNAKFPKKAALYQSDSKQGITNNEIMGTLICIKHILPFDNEWIRFVETLELLLEKYPHARNGIISSS